MSAGPYEAHERFPRQITPNYALQPTCERRTRLTTDVRLTINYGEIGFGGKRKTFEVNDVDSI